MQHPDSSLPNGLKHPEHIFLYVGQRLVVTMACIPGCLSKISCCDGAETHGNEDFCQPDHAQIRSGSDGRCLTACKEGDKISGLEQKVLLLAGL